MQSTQKNNLTDMKPPPIKSPLKSAPSSAAKDIEYTCPMHSQIRQVGPGNCPICGMNLEPVKAQVEEKEDNAEYLMMSKRFWVSLALSIPLVFITMGGRSLFHGEAVQKAFFWGEIILATPVVLWGGFTFFDQGRFNWDCASSRN